MERKLIPLQSLAKLAFQEKALFGLFGQTGFVKQELSAPFFFGLVHCEVCVLDKGRNVVAIGGKTTNADRCAHIQFMALYTEGLRQRRQNLSRHALGSVPAF